MQVFHKKKARLENTKDVVYTSNENVSSETKIRIDKTDDLVYKSIDNEKTDDLV